MNRRWRDTNYRTCSVSNVSWKITKRKLLSRGKLLNFRFFSKQFIEKWLTDPIEYWAQMNQLKLFDSCNPDWVQHLSILGKSDKLNTPCVIKISTAVVKYNHTFFLIWAGESVRKMEEVGSLELIFVFAPCRAGKNVENIRDGFGQPSRGATSRVILK